MDMMMNLIESVKNATELADGVPDRVKMNVQKIVQIIEFLKINIVNL